MDKETRLYASSTRPELGNIHISSEAIAMVAGIAAMECYGIVGMSSRTLQDGIAELLGRENLTRGIEVEIDDDRVIIDLFVVMEYGVKMNEVALNVISRVKYTVETQLGLSVDRVNVNIQGVRTGVKVTTR